MVHYQHRKRESEHEGGSSFKEGLEDGVDNSDNYDSRDSHLELESTR